MTSPVRTVGRIALGAVLLYTGVAHLTFGRRAFRVAVPKSLPFDPDTTVVASGVAELGLGVAMIISRQPRGLIGTLTALFFVAVFPGNVSQWMHQRNAVGLDTDMKRFVRLFLQPVLVVWALWSTRGESRA